MKFPMLHWPSFLFTTSASISRTKRSSDVQHNSESSETQALDGLAPKCKLINMHELINKFTNDYVTLLPCENGANVNNKG